MNAIDRAASALFRAWANSPGQRLPVTAPEAVALRRAVSDAWNAGELPRTAMRRATDALDNRGIPRRYLGDGE